MSLLLIISDTTIAPSKFLLINVHVVRLRIYEINYLLVRHLITIGMQLITNIYELNLLIIDFTKKLQLSFYLIWCKSFKNESDKLLLLLLF